MLTLSRMGIPCKGPLELPSDRSLSSFAAADSNRNLGVLISQPYIWHPSCYVSQSGRGMIRLSGR